jgi:hypothetical protein
MKRGKMGKELHKHLEEKQVHRKHVSHHKLKTYINKFLAKGYSKGYLKKFLVERGYDKDKVDLAYKELGLEMDLGKYVAMLPKWSYYVIAIVLVLGIVGVLLPTDQPGQQDCGRSSQCFIKAANKCKDSVFRQNLEGSVIEYISSVDCDVTKQFKSFAATEPQEIVTLFQGLQMKCGYDKGNFNTATVESLVGNIENCDGLLKDAIYELRIAQIELGLG